MSYPEPVYLGGSGLANATFRPAFRRVVFSTSLTPRKIKAFVVRPSLAARDFRRR